MSTRIDKPPPPLTQNVQKVFNRSEVVPIPQNKETSRPEYNYD